MSETRWLYKHYPLATWYIAIVLTALVVVFLIGG